MARKVGSSDNSAAAVAERAVDQSKVLELVASGLTVTAAANTLGISRKHASELYNRALADTLRESTEQRQMLVARQLETLRLIQQAWMPKALRGDYQAARVVLQVVKDTNALLGLNAAIQVEISQKNIDSVVSEVLTLLEGGGDRPMVLDAEVVP